MAERLTPEQLDQPIELDVDEDRQTVRSLLSRLIGQMGMWNAALANRDYDWSVEEHAYAQLDARAARGGGPDVPHPRPRRGGRGTPRRHVRRRAVRARRGVHLRRHDRARADLRRAPPDPGRAGPRHARGRGPRLGQTRCAGWPNRPPDRRSVRCGASTRALWCADPCVVVRRPVHCCARTHGSARREARGSARENAARKNAPVARERRTGRPARTHR